MIVHATNFRSFSVLDLVLIGVFVAITVIVSFSLEIVMSFIRQRRERVEMRRRMWVLNETLQMQRVIYERLGKGDWQGKADEVSTTDKGQLLDFFDTAKEHFSLPVSSPTSKPNAAIQVQTTQVSPTN
jgi:hypothetical protein